MEGHVWCMIEELLGAVDGRPARCQYSNREILRVTLWAVLHDRPMSWACEAISWPETLRPARLPDDSTISRRWKGASLIEQADLLYETSLRRFAPGRDAVVDGRPLPVGGCSKDPDARAGQFEDGLGVIRKAMGMDGAEEGVGWGGRHGVSIQDCGSPSLRKASPLRCRGSIGRRTSG